MLAVMTRRLSRDMLPAPWDSSSYVPLIETIDGKKRERTQKTFYDAMHYQGKNAEDKEKRDDLWEHYNILDLDAKWMFVKSYHTAKKKASWRDFVLDFGKLPEEALVEVEADDALDRERRRML